MIVSGLDLAVRGLDAGVGQVGVEGVEDALPVVFASSAKSVGALWLR